ncbi:MAG: hypothetical protein ABW184_02645 [Sphingobium sp.]
MIEQLTPHRPGLTAIAAVLALSSTPVLAQVALPDVSAQAAPAAPAQAPPMAAPPVAAAPVQTVQSLPPPAPTLPEVSVAQTPAPTRSVERAAAPRAERAAARTAEPQAPAAQAQPREVAQSAPAAPSRRPEPIVDIVRDDAPATTAVPATRSAATSNDLGYADWMVIGGGLLLVAGGAAFAMRRRPRRTDERSAVSAVTVGDVAFVRQEPVRTRTAVARDIAPASAPVMAPITAATGSVGKPAVYGSDRDAALATMVSDPRSATNPFLTRRNRLRRANFLLRTGQASPVADTTPQPKSAAPGFASDRWSETRLAGKSATRINWKPATR